MVRRPRLSRRPDALAEVDEDCIDTEIHVIEEARTYLMSSASADERTTIAPDAWDRFYRAYDPLVQKLARSQTRPGADAADGAQEVWAVLVRRLPGFRYDPRRGRFRAWLMVVARRVLADWCRARRSHEPFPTGWDVSLLGREPDPGDTLERDEVRQWVRTSLAELRMRISETSYQVVVQRWIEGRDTLEIAAQLGLTIEQVWSRHHRAAAELRRFLIRRLGEDLAVAGRSAPSPQKKSRIRAMPTRVDPYLPGEG